MNLKLKEDSLKAGSENVRGYRFRLRRRGKRTHDPSEEAAPGDAEHWNRVYVMSFPWILVMGLAIIIVGGLLEYLVSLLLYKAPMSKYAQSSILRREL